ncbi:hypothetical protein A7K50_12375 [Dehalobacter sp. MCB1]|uniref:hypothetical protein n=1 Tax=Dehalobacter sp. MCB1 TaxID=1844756 RepID=UPI000E6C6A72|nr:hypothetical protein [Dehalobacter sp. MCB1]RJE46814.1 hypothetical protein A7K50_12375 [Dehalobacter sp. MCB1]
MTSVITPKQRDRLFNRPKYESDEELLKDRRLNDFYVRKAIKRWLGSIQDIHLALNTLPERQIFELFKDEVKDEDVFALLEMVELSLVTLDFIPIQRNAEGKLIAAKSLLADPKEDGSPRWFSVDREATDLDTNRHSTLQKHISRLEKFVSSRQHAICNYLDRIYLKDLIIKAKKDGYEPVILPEKDRFIPRLTPEQYHFQKLQGTLGGLGFKHIEYQSDIEILKEALRTEEGKALLQKFKSMQEQLPQ